MEKRRIPKAILSGYDKRVGLELFLGVQTWMIRIRAVLFKRASLGWLSLVA